MTTVKELDRAIWNARSKYGPQHPDDVILPLPTQSKAPGLIILFIVVAFIGWLLSSVFGAEARTFRTPVGTTCDEVRYWYHALGGEAGVREYGRVHNITLTVHQYRKARACLRIATKGF